MTTFVVIVVIVRVKSSLFTCKHESCHRSVALTLAGGELLQSLLI